MKLVYKVVRFEGVPGGVRFFLDMGNGFQYMSVSFKVKEMNGIVISQVGNINWCWWWQSPGGVCPLPVG
jgi:hypothetical protein